jgi:hypothetical protein
VDTPTAAEVRARSALLRVRYPPPVAPATDEPADLLAVIEDASAVVGALTGRLIAPLEVGEEVPPGKTHLAVRAVARMAELMDTEGAADFADVSARGRRLRSFSAGPYSEAYFSPDELVPRRGQQGRPQFSPDPTLDRLLWALATQDAIDLLIALASGIQPPAGLVTEFDFRASGGRYYSGGRWVGIGPDGF